MGPKDRENEPKNMIESVEVDHRMKEFKDAQIGSQWELSNGCRAVIVKRIDGTIHSFVAWVDRPGQEAYYELFTDAGKPLHESAYIKAPWREKLKWEGEVIMRDNIDSVYADNVELKDNLIHFIGKKTRMTLEEL